MNKLLDKAKIAIFTHPQAAFFGSLITQLEIVFSDSVPFAAVSDTHIYLNPDKFKDLPKESRSTLLLHELDHIARLHKLRRGTREHKLWNVACDAIINRARRAEGASFKGLESGIFLDDYPQESEEALYQALVEKGYEPPSEMEEDLQEGSGDSIEAQTLVNLVQRAVQQAEMIQSGSVPGNIKSLLENFTNPKIDYTSLLIKYLTEKSSKVTSWNKRNRRYKDMILPSKIRPRNRLAPLNIYLDVSGSVTIEDIKEFNNGAVYIKEIYNPPSMMLVQFDWIIQKEDEILETDLFDRIKIVGGGGTNLEPVREHIEKTKPSLSIIFSDLYCPPMTPINHDGDVLWVILNNPNAYVPFGEVIHLRTDNAY